MTWWVRSGFILLKPMEQACAGRALIHPGARAKQASKRRTHKEPRGVDRPAEPLVREADRLVGLHEAQVRVEGEEADELQHGEAAQGEGADPGVPRGQVRPAQRVLVRVDDVPARSGAGLA